MNSNDPQSQNFPRKLTDVQGPTFQEKKTIFVGKQPAQSPKQSAPDFFKDHPSEQIISLILIIAALAVAWILY